MISAWKIFSELMHRFKFNGKNVMPNDMKKHASIHATISAFLRMILLLLSHLDIKLRDTNERFDNRIIFWFDKYPFVKMNTAFYCEVCFTFPCSDIIKTIFMFVIKIAFQQGWTYLACAHHYHTHTDRLITIWWCLPSFISCFNCICTFKQYWNVSFAIFKQLQTDA